MIRTFDGLWHDVGLALAGQGLDLATCLLAFRYAVGGREGNPLMASVYTAGGPVYTLLVKMGLTLFALAIVGLYMRRQSAERRWGRIGLLMVAAVGIVGAVTNVLALV